MTISLYFDPAKFSRTIGRKEWHEIWRWKRITQKQLVAEVAKERQMLVTFGSTMDPRIKRDIMDRMINPPLLVHDRMDVR